MAEVEILKQQIAECDKKIEELDITIEAMAFLFQKITGIAPLDSDGNLLPALKNMRM